MVTKSSGSSSFPFLIVIAMLILGGAAFNSAKVKFLLKSSTSSLYNTLEKLDHYLS
jgi:hypothetical protein